MVRCSEEEAGDGRAVSIVQVRHEYIVKKVFEGWGFVGLSEKGIEL